MRYLFIMKFVQLGTQIKTRCEKKKINKQKYTKIHKKYIIKYINLLVTLTLTVEFSRSALSSLGESSRSTLNSA